MQMRQDNPGYDEAFQLILRNDIGKKVILTPIKVIQK